MNATKQPAKYEAVTMGDLVRRLGQQCSPMADRQGYVIGPDVNGRICHVATCFTLAEARERADRLNAPPLNLPAGHSLTMREFEPRTFERHDEGTERATLGEVQP